MTSDNLSVERQESGPISMNEYRLVRRIENPYSPICISLAPTLALCP